jgi:DNA-directed RNA polymerase subunit RPC12/RpoP
VNHRKKIKYEDFRTVIKKRWPRIHEKDWQWFIASQSTYDLKMLSRWGKHMETKITMNDKLVSCGYCGMHRMWKNEDATALEARKYAPLSYLQPRPTKDFVRAAHRFT